MTRAEERAARFDAELARAQTPEQRLAIGFAWLRGSAAHTSKRGHGFSQYGEHRDVVVEALRSVTEVLTETARELDALGESPVLAAVPGVRCAS
jgi:hypothetical protein